MNYNERLVEYNTKLSDLYEQIENLPVAKSNISFKGEAQKSLSIACERPTNIILTSDTRKNGKIQQLPGGFPIGQTDAVVTVYDDKIYLFGGWTHDIKGNLKNDVFYYDLKLAALVDTGIKIPIHISGASAVTYKDMIYIFGGNTVEYGMTNKIFKFNPKTAELVTLAISLPTKVIVPKTILNPETGEIYLLAGKATGEQALTNIYKIDLENNIVTTLDLSLNTPVYYNATAYDDSRIYIIGGGISVEDGVDTQGKTKYKTVAQSLIQYFDYKTMTTGTLPVSLTDPLCYGEAAFYNDKIYTFGGTNDSTSYTTINVVDLLTNTVSAYGQQVPWSSRYSASALVGNTFFNFSGSINYARSESYCISLYQEDTCVIVTDTALTNDSLLSIDGTNTSLLASITDVKFVKSNGSVTSVNWSVDKHELKNTSSTYNFGTEAKFIEGYLQSPNLNFIPTSIAIKAQCDYVPSQSESSKQMAERNTVSGAAVYGDNIYVFGGWSADTRGSSKYVYVYTPSTDSLRKLDNIFPLPVSSQRTAVINNLIYLVGGWADTGEGTGTTLNSVYVFDPGSETVTETSIKLPVTTINGALAQYDEMLYYFGGTNNNNGIIAIDIKNSKATKLDVQLPYSVYQTSFAQQGSKVYFFGGEDGAANKSFLWSFDLLSYESEVLYTVNYDAVYGSMTILDNYVYLLDRQGNQHVATKFNLLTKEATDISFKLSYTGTQSCQIRVGNVWYFFGGDISGGTGHSKKIYKIVLNRVVPKNTITFHISDDGVNCIPYINGEIQVQARVDAIYRGSDRGFSQSLSNVSTYHNGTWIPIC